MGRTPDPITPGEDVIDSRHVIERLEYLEALLEDEVDLEGDEHEEYEFLCSLEEQAQGYAPDWRYGALLIEDSHFEDYAREMADGLGLISLDARWPNDHIDWTSAADELRQDYTSLEFGGWTYWVR